MQKDVFIESEKGDDENKLEGNDIGLRRDEVQPIWTHKGGNSDSLANEIHWIVGIPVLQLYVC